MKAEVNPAWPGALTIVPIRVVRGVRLLAFHEVDRLFEVFGLDLVIGLRDGADRHC